MGLSLGAAAILCLATLKGVQTREYWKEGIHGMFLMPWVRPKGPTTEKRVSWLPVHHLALPIPCDHGKL
jgi:hypothetical protein